MADAAPAGGGWGALEIILAIVLGIGLIATLTGTPLPGSASTTSSTKKATAANSTNDNSYSIAGCTLVISNPLKNAQIDNTVIINGSITACLNQNALPTVLNAQVTDSTGTFLSILTPLNINKNIFGDLRFSAVVPLSGVAHSTKATVTISGPTAVIGSDVNIRIPINLTPIAATTTTYITPTSVPTTYTTPTTYIAPAQTTTQTSGSTNSTTF